MVSGADGVILGAIAEAARRGARCPSRSEFEKVLAASGTELPRGGISAATTRLCREGHLRIEVYGRNWRVAEILTGAEKGKRTAPPPHGGQPYLVVGVTTERFYSSSSDSFAPRSSGACTSHARESDA